MEGIRIVSDLHLELHMDTSKRHWEKVIPSLNEKNDILILAGDICSVSTPNLRKHLQSFLTWCKIIWDKIVYIPGNHEYYGLSIEQGNIFLKEICDSVNVTLLCPGIYELNDEVMIVGATLWSTIPMSQHRTIKNGVNDFIRIIDNSIEAHNMRFQSDLNFITSELNKLAENSINKKTIIVTHFVPDLETAELEGSNLTAFFGTDILSSFEKHKNRIIYWIYGHSHINRRGEVNGINLMCNQVGYSWLLAERDDYVPDLRL
jgi:predicted phosphohydrolase